MSVQIVRADTEFGSKVFATKDSIPTYCYRAAKAVGTKAEAEMGLLLLLAGSIDNVKFKVLKTIHDARDGNAVRAEVNKFNEALNAPFFPTDELKSRIRRNVKPRTGSAVFSDTPRIREGERAAFQADRAMVDIAIEQAVKAGFWTRIYKFIFG